MRVERAFAFVDLSGFTAFAERYGDDHTVAVLTAFRGRVREIAARRGVRVTKWLGDGAMLSSADTSAVVALVVELADRMPGSLPLGLRAGLANGAVIMFEGDDYIGRPANVAARLCDMAETGQVLATREVASQAPRWVASGPLVAMPVQGLDRPVEATVLSVAVSESTSVDPCCGLTLPVERGLDTRFGADGQVVRFCSTACALAWEDSGRRPRPPLEVASPIR
ncbi:MAG TPA: adenylate/guanylate cyclase domain-containing protein [Acidimicrobiales bacterium]|jgi:class 3 adenylate cyclase|nr:adenylate/guanylate cyclase domain-containing protein [Acidimicrobiales bacterium]